MGRPCLAHLREVLGETLVEPHPADKSAVPVLAVSWESDAEAKVWTFALRQGVTFHNGQPMTSDDVVKTLRRHADEKSQSAALGVLRDIASIEADGPERVIVTLKGGNVDLPLLLSDYHLIIQPGGGLDNPDAGIGTGPYRVVKADPGVQYLAEKVPGHWRTDVGHVDAIELLIINDSTARLSALRSKRVHMINQVDPKTARLVEGMNGISVQNAQGGGHYVFAMQTDVPPFDNNDLRMALKLAIDRQELVDRILQGYGSVGNDFPINSSYPMAPADIEQRTFDPDLARSYYEKSGHSGPIVLRVSDVAFAGAVDAAVLFQLLPPRPASPSKSTAAFGRLLERGMAPRRPSSPPTGRPGRCRITSIRLPIWQASTGMRLTGTDPNSISWSSMRGLSSTKPSASRCSTTWR